MSSSPQPVELLYQQIGLESKTPESRGKALLQEALAMSMKEDTEGATVGIKVIEGAGDGLAVVGAEDGFAVVGTMDTVGPGDGVYVGAYVGARDGAGTSSMFGFKRAV